MYWKSSSSGLRNGDPRIARLLLEQRCDPDASNMQPADSRCLFSCCLICVTEGFGYWPTMKGFQQNKQIDILINKNGNGPNCFRPREAHMDWPFEVKIIPLLVNPALTQGVPHSYMGLLFAKTTSIVIVIRWCYIWLHASSHRTLYFWSDPAKHHYQVREVGYRNNMRKLEPGYHQFNGGPESLHN